MCLTHFCFYSVVMNIKYTAAGVSVLPYSLLHCYNRVLLQLMYVAPCITTEYAYVAIAYWVVDRGSQGLIQL